MKKVVTALFAAAAALAGQTTTATASEPFVGEIRSFGFSFCPQGWAALDGQLLSVSSNAALFSLLGTIYGGDGRTTFGLPDLRGRIPLHQGTGPGLTNRRLGAKGGQETTTMTAATMPSHTHAPQGNLKAKMVGSGDAPSTNDPAGAYLGTFSGQSTYATTAPGRKTDMGDGSVTVDISTVNILNNGGQQPTTNMAPYLVNNYCISLFGVYPSRH